MKSPHWRVKSNLKENERFSQAQDPFYTYWWLPPFICISFIANISVNIIRYVFAKFCNSLAIYPSPKGWKKRCLKHRISTEPLNYIIYLKTLLHLFTDIARPSSETKFQWRTINIYVWQHFLLQAICLHKWTMEWGGGGSVILINNKKKKKENQTWHTSFHRLSQHPTPALGFKHRYI